MENSNGQKSLFPPTREQVQAWVKRDVHAMAYFVSMLIKHPEIVEKLGNELYDKSQETGALIDNAKPLHEEKTLHPKS